MSSVVQSLFFKDDVYRAIFDKGDNQFDIDINKFYFNEFGVYGSYIGYNRWDVYSNAEILFGAHTQFSLAGLIEALITEAFAVTAIFFEPLAIANACIDLFVILFFAMSITENDLASYVADIADKGTSTLDANGEFVENSLFSVAMTAANIIPSLLEGSFIVMPEMELGVYKTIDAPYKYYRTIYKIGATEVSLNDIIEYCD